MIAKNEGGYFEKPLIKGVLLLTNLTLKGYIVYREIKEYIIERKRARRNLHETDPFKTYPLRLVLAL